MADDETMTEDGADEGGLSTPKRIAAGAALGVAVPAAVGVARKLLGGSGEPRHDDDGSDDDGDDSSEPTSRERAERRPSPAQRKPRSQASKKPAGTKARSTGTRTREQLYKQATRLKIEGRSGMNKAQLERAVARAKSK